MKLFKTITIAALLLANLVVNSQKYYSYSDSSENITYPDIFKRNYLKLSPLNFFEVEPSIQLGYEYQVNPNLRIQHEIGYISFFNPLINIFNFDWNQGDPSNGIRIRTTFKFPLKTLDNYYKGRKDYLGIDLMGKYFKYTTTNVLIDRYSNSYSQYMDLTYEKYVLGIHLIYGYENYLNLPNNFVNDFYFGLGIRYKSMTNDIPQDSDYYNDLSFFDTWQGTMLSVMAGYKIGFGI